RVVLLSTLSAWGPSLPAILMIAALGSIATEIRLAIGRKLGVADGIGFRLAQHLLVWTILPAPVLHASVIWGGAITSPVVWRHVRYVVDKTGQVIDVARRPYSDAPGSARFSAYMRISSPGRRVRRQDGDTTASGAKRQRTR